MASNASDSKILEYKDTISQLNKTIEAQSELIRSLREDHTADREMIKTLQEQIDYLTQKLFGTSSEKRTVIDGQMNLFDEAEHTADIDIKAPEIVIPEHKRKAKITHEELFKGIPSRHMITVIPQYREYSSVQSCLNTNAGRK